MAAPVVNRYLISRVADPVFAIIVGTSAAFVRIRREHRANHPGEPSDLLSLLALGKGRFSRWWNSKQ
ncbi:hypothetical protein VTO42DRAFT_8355 [Malbranchea cinnamomea]